MSFHLFEVCESFVVRFYWLLEIFYLLVFALSSLKSCNEKPWIWFVSKVPRGIFQLQKAPELQKVPPLSGWNFSGCTEEDKVSHPSSCGNISRCVFVSNYGTRRLLFHNK